MTDYLNSAPVKPTTAHSLIQSVQHLPTGRQGGVDVHGLPEGVDS